MKTMGRGSKANRRKRRYQSPNRDGKRRRLPQTDSPAKDGDDPKVMFFQECAQSILNPHTNKPSDVDGKTDTASVFFDLANSPLVGYQIEDNRAIVIRQDNNCAIHTGGIVWETSYLLAVLSSVNTLISLTRLSTNYELAIEAKRSRHQLIGESFVCVSPAGDLAT
jgi:hypothetical protein